MFHVHLHVGGDSGGSVHSEAIGDGTLLKLILQYGPVILALLVQYGIIKLPPGFNLPTAPAGDGNVSDQP